MRRAQRGWHRGLWLVLAPLGVLAVVLAVVAREPVPSQAPLELEPAPNFGAATVPGDAQDPAEAR